jgi:hypothetical protein
MITSIMVSGEGSGDIGSIYLDKFTKGPMSILIEKVLKRHMPYWNRDYFNNDVPLNFKYVSHGFLKKKAENTAKGNGKFSLPGKGIYKLHGGQYKQARELAKLSIENECQVAIYFMDCDGKNSDKNIKSSRQSDIVETINTGLRKGKAQSGIAMVPKPTSEAWLICHCQTTPYLNCGPLEINLSGNDKCPDENSPKKVLEKYICVDYADAVVVDKAQEIDIDRIEMSSFKQFKSDAKSAIRQICGTFED